MSREIMPSSTDRSVFRRTASKSKSVNLGVVSMRGGIRF